MSNQPIKGQLYTTASIVLEALLSSKTNMAPQSPEHAHRAYGLAQEIWSACRENGLLAQAAARAIGGFLQNVQSSHATDQELLSLGLNAAGQLAEAFRAPTVEAPNFATRRVVPRAQVPQPSASTQVPPAPQMPPAPGAAPAEFIPPSPPVTSLDVPDFES